MMLIMMTTTNYNKNNDNRLIVCIVESLPGGKLTRVQRVLEIEWWRKHVGTMEPEAGGLFEEHASVDAVQSSIGT